MSDNSSESPPLHLRQTENLGPMAVEMIDERDREIARLKCDLVEARAENAKLKFQIDAIHSVADGALKVVANQQQDIAEARRTAIAEFCDAVCRKAESNMLKTGKLEGAHYAAMCQLRDEICTTASEAGEGEKHEN